MISGPLTDVRDNLSETVDKVSQTGEVFVITKHGRPTAVLMGFDEYESLLESLNILSDDDTMAALAEADADIAEGRVERSA
jgi:antitoxin YefM